MYIEGKMETSDKLHGYKLMHLKCVQSVYALTQETVRLLLQIIDPLGTASKERKTKTKYLYKSWSGLQVAHRIV